MTVGARLRPEREPVELGGEARGAVAEPLGEQPRRLRVELESAPGGLGAQPSRQVARLRRRVGEHLAAGLLHRLGERLRRPQLRRLLAGDEDDGDVRAAAPRSPRPRAPPASPTSARRRRRAGSGGRRSARASGSRPAAPRRRGRRSTRAAARTTRARPARPRLSARARSRASAASSFATSVPAIRYAGAISGLSRGPAKGAECIRRLGRSRGPAPPAERTDGGA